MVWADYLTGQELYVDGVLQSPRRKAWNFIGVTVDFNASTNMWDLTVGAGSGGHIVEDEGTPLTQRGTLNFVGVNVTVTDAGGKTVVTIGPVALGGAAVSGTLPIVRGGTGLGALGTAGQSLRVNAGATALEYYTPAAGITVPGGDGHRFTYSTTTTDADPGAGTFRANNATLSSATQLYVDLAEFGATDVTAWLDSLDDNVGTIKGRIRLASIADPTKWIVYNLTAWTTATGYRKLTVAYVAGPGSLPTTAGDIWLSFDSGPVGGITDTEVATGAAIVLSKLADGAARSLVGVAGAAGPHTDIANGTNGFVYLRRSDAITAALLLNENIDAAAAIAVSKLAIGTALQQLRVNAGGTSLEYFSQPTLVSGGNLTDASATKHVSDGTQFTLPAATLSADRTLTLGTSGTPEIGEMVEIVVHAQGATFDYAIANGGPLGGTLYTVVATTKRVVHAQWNGTDWVFAGLARLA